MNSRFTRLLAAILMSVASLPAMADDTARKLVFDALGLIGKSAPLPADVARENAPAAAASNASCPRVKRRAPMGPLGPRPETYQPAILWPENFECEFTSFSDLTFEAARAQEKAFREASKVPCRACEGGYDYDAWANKILAKGHDYSAKFQSMLLDLKLGQALHWKGARYQGTIQATGEHPIGPFPCRQYHWTLKDAAQVVAQREGLLCEYKRPYAASAAWHEVL